MQYKGEDMDLRVPNARAPRETYAATDYDPAYSNGRWSRGGGSVEPLWVDETVLACCNHAFDMALAHGAAEVGLEHLVNALTRVEAAARVLEGRGVREAQLRRDSATLIASEIATNLGGERTAPRRSAEMEDVLRRTVEQSGRRGAVATVDDLLWVLLHWGRDVPAIQLLRRMTPDWQRPDWGRGRESPAPYAEPLRFAPEQPRYAVPLQGDGLVHRLGALEDSLRGLHAELSSDRKGLADLIRDVQRDIVAQRSDAASLRGDIGQRLETLERSVQVRGDTSRIPGQLIDRLQQLEKAVHSGLGEGARNWAALGQRLQAFETALAAREPDTSAKPLLERITGIERLFETGASERARNWTALSERLGGIETFLTSRTEEPQREPGELTERVAGLERAVRAGFGDATRLSTLVADRMVEIEKHLGQPLSDESEAVLIVDDRLQSIERILDDRGREQALAATQLITRLDALEHKSGVTNFDAPGLALPFAETSERVLALERMLRTSMVTHEEATRARDREVADMHDALIRLSENQHTLASAISDWRSESNTAFGAINAQVERLAGTTPPLLVTNDVVDMPNVVTTRSSVPPMLPGDDPGDIRRARSGDELAGETATEAIDRTPEVRGRGFWWWLFGTGNVRQANRDSEMRWERIRERLKEAQERRRRQA